MLEQVMGAVRESLTVRRVYAEPYRQDGVTIIPAAAVSGGGGGGGGRRQARPADAEGGAEADGGADGAQEEGEGGGFGLNARPAGAFVLRDGKVRWRPALDLNRLVLVAGAVGVAYLLTRRRRRR